METEENMEEANGDTVVPPPIEVTLIDGVDSVLIDALQNASKRERNLTFKLEDNIVKFLSPSVKEKKLVFPPLPPHHRLILHRLADRFNLSHVVRDEKNTHRRNKSDSCTKRSGKGKNKMMILYKRDDTKLPDFLLIDKFGKKSKKMKKKIILRRKENAALCEKDGEDLHQQDSLLGDNSQNRASANTTAEKDKHTSQAGGEASKTQEEIEMENKITEYEEVKKRIFGVEGMNTEGAIRDNEMEGNAAAILDNDNEREANKQVNFRDIQDDLNDPDFIRNPIPQHHRQIGGMHGHGHVNNHMQFVPLPQQQIAPAYQGMQFSSNQHPQILPYPPMSYQHPGMHPQPAMMQPYMPIQQQAYPIMYNAPPPPYMYPMYMQQQEQQQQQYSPHKQNGYLNVDLHNGKKSAQNQGSAKD